MNESKHKRVRKRRWLPGAIGVLLLLVLWQLFTNIYRDEEKELRVRLREAVREHYPEEAARFSENFGLSLFEMDVEGSPGAVSRGMTVVLIHGLDDPGKVWMNLAPELVREGFAVWIMNYPNDQPVVESAWLFTEELKGLRRTGVPEITIVAHSMGGLVSREMLTNPDMEYSALVSSDLAPQVEELIMVGTPNHGSHLARFRVFAEWRDQFIRLTKGEASWQGTILDGAGEAKIDLVPGSRFLTELNARPHPDGLEMFIVAGITSPWNEGDIDAWVSDMSRKVPGEQRDLVNSIGEYMMLMTHGLGDGLVTVESTMLEGVPHQTVDGTHLSMIRNVLPGSERIPPAVPVIVEHLKGEGTGP